MITLALSIFVNTQVVERYYLRRQTGYVEAAGQRLEALIGRGMEPGEAAEALEETEKVLVAVSYTHLDVYKRQRHRSEERSPEAVMRTQRDKTGFRRLRLPDAVRYIRKGRY